MLSVVENLIRKTVPQGVVQAPALNRTALSRAFTATEWLQVRLSVIQI
jgi:hypothetical protein